MTARNKRLLLALKSIIALIVVLAVGWQFAKLLRSPELYSREVHVRWEYLGIAGLLYLGCHFIWGTFWVQLLWFEGVKVSWWIGIRAYFVSQLAKYIPGKAWTILLRVAILRPYGASATVVTFSATYETLTNMAAGAMLGVCLLPWAGLGIAYDSHEGLALLGLAALPLGVIVLNRMAKKLVAKFRGPDARPLPSPSMFLIARGLVQALVGWGLLGLSLWFTVAALATHPQEFNAHAIMQDLAAVTIAYVFGFVVFILPGGVGARETVLQKVLAVQLAASELAAAQPVAALIALILRLVWTGFEVAVSLLAWALGQHIRIRRAINLPPSAIPLD